MSVVLSDSVFAIQSTDSPDIPIPQLEPVPFSQSSGRPKSLVEYWFKAVDYYEKNKQTKRLIDALMHLGEAHQQLGNFKEAFENLQRAGSLADKTADRFRLTMAEIGLGNVHFLLGNQDKAKEHIERGIEQARAGNQSDALTAGLISLGNLLAVQKQYDSAQDAYQQAYQQASQTGNTILASKSLINAAKNALFNDHYTQSQEKLALALEQIEKIEDNRSQANLFIAAGEIAQRLMALVESHRSRLKLMAYKSLKHGAEISERLGAKLALSQALGNLALLYRYEKSTEEALNLTDRAIFIAQSIDAPDLVYRWQWQKGQLLASMGKTKQAVSAYRQAAQSIQSLRQAQYKPNRFNRLSFREEVGSMFLEFADLLLQIAETVDDPEQTQLLLVDARQAVEQMKTAELKDYFQDDCVTALQAKITPLQKIVQQTAVIYPILLKDRTEILLTLSDGIKRIQVSIDKDSLTREIRAFRRNLEKRTTRQFMRHSWKLYDWLIRPLEPILHSRSIDTLVVVPDGPLRTIPFAALHDGKHFLIKRFAIATTPGLTLMDPRPLSRGEMQILASGITDAIHGFPALPFVKTELDNLQQLYGGRQLVNDSFLLDSMRNELKNTSYNIVHIASHGQFKSDPLETFILTFDDKLTMDRLEQFIGVSRYRDKPVELLTLSACETAAGDDRAALGMAGVAVKAGARSALATLWVSNDEATAALISDFYQQLKSPDRSKAKALQKAQIGLINDKRFRHPIYWSPFILIGNWL